MQRSARLWVLMILAALAVSPITADDDKAKFRYKKGFEFESADGDFSLKLTNRVQVRFTYEDPDTGDSIGSFRLRRFKLKMAGRIFADWQYKLQVNFAGQGDRTVQIEGEEILLEQNDVLEDAWFQYTKYRWVQPWLGQGKVFFGRERLTSSGKLMFVDRALLSDEAEVERDDGVGLVGYNEGRTFEYNVGIYNGNFLNQTRNDNGKFAYAARAVWTPLGEYKLEESALDYPDRPKLAIGVGAYENTITNEEGTDLEIKLLGPEFAIKLQGFSAQAEYYRIRLDLATGGAGDVDTGYLQFGYLFPGRKFELAGRIADTHPSAEAASVSAEERELGIGANYYFSGHDYKLQADLRNLDDRSPADEDQVEVRVQMQFAF